MRARPADDARGFTLTELTVVMSLIGVLLAVAFAGMKAVYSGREVSDRQAWFSREIGQPLVALEKSLTQNIRLESATPYSVTVLVDRPRTVAGQPQYDNLERHVFAATTTGNLTETIYSMDTLRNNTGLIRTVVWSKHANNQARAVPMFSFRDATGASITATAAPTSARRVDVRIVTVYDGRSFEGTRTIFFRNR